jgi:hypothetical protein
VHQPPIISVSRRLTATAAQLADHIRAGVFDGAVPDAVTELQALAEHLDLLGEEVAAMEMRSCV